jgi:hypothetical protein
MHNDRLLSTGSSIQYTNLYTDFGATAGSNQPTQFADSDASHPGGSIFAGGNSTPTGSVTR